jgi:hypothetical protein
MGEAPTTGVALVAEAGLVALLRFGALSAGAGFGVLLRVVAFPVGAALAILPEGVAFSGGAAFAVARGRARAGDSRDGLEPLEAPVPFFWPFGA